jgi:hypothetical protein
MRWIDLKAILHRNVSGLYGDLVTRPTGKAVRDGIEQALAESEGEQVAVIDFSAVRCLDFSCADEIVGKLLREYGHARYFVLHGVTASHCEAIEHVLERHQLAVLARDRDGRIRVLGPVSDKARRAVSDLSDRRTADSDEPADPLVLSTDVVHDVLEELRARRLVQRESQDRTSVTTE